ncbi:MAG: prolipoprotein diacylglyceryl transferase [Anaerolineae bacterium]
MQAPDPIIFHIGPLALRWYGILIVTGAIAAAYVATFEANRRRENPDHVWNALIWVLIAGIVGARLYHVFSTPQGTNRNLSYYLENPVDILKIWEGGLGIYGAVLGGVLAIWIYARRNNLSIWRWLDIAAPGVLLAQAIGRWGNFFNQELYGPPTTLPWGIPITNALQRIPPYDDLTLYPLDATRFHPTFLYESTWNFVWFLILMWGIRRFRARLRDGDVISLYLIIYPLGRIIVESFRPDAWTLYGIPTAQIVSGLSILLGIGLMVWRRQVGGDSSELETVPQRRRPGRKPKGRPAR